MKTIFYPLAVMAFAMAVPSVPAAAGPAPEKESAVKQELRTISACTALSGTILRSTRERVLREPETFFIIFRLKEI